MIAGRARAMGLGPLHTISLADAREMAGNYRKQVLQGTDPIDERRRERTVAIGRKTFRECAKEFLEAHQSSWKNAKHRQQPCQMHWWIRSPDG